MKENGVVTDGLKFKKAKAFHWETVVVTASWNFFRDSVAQ
jgi:hypothetical protein